jgi:hypothetical protein
VYSQATFLTAPSSRAQTITAAAFSIYRFSPLVTSIRDGGAGGGAGGGGFGCGGGDLANEQTP